LIGNQGVVLENAVSMFEKKNSIDEKNLQIKSLLKIL
jgi:hypothetical protein